MTVAAHRPSTRGSARRGSATTRQRPAYRSAARRTIADAFEADHVASGRLGRFRWLLSTLLAATVGSLAIAMVILGSLDSLERPGDKMPTLNDIASAAPVPPPMAAPASGGMVWSSPKVDRLASVTGAMSAKHVLQEQFQVKRDNRAFIDVRNYVRVLARLSSVPPQNAAAIPAFNPLKLYGPVESSAQDGDTGDGEQSPLTLAVNDILGGALAIEDGHEMDVGEATAMVTRTLEAEAEALAIRPTLVSDNGAELLSPRDTAADRALRRKPEAMAQTTVLTKSSGERDQADDIDRNEIRIVKVARGDTLMKIISRFTSDAYLVKALAEAAKSLLPDAQLALGLEVHVTLVPSLSQANKLEPAAYSVYGEGRVHKVSVARDSSGEFVASQSPVNAQLAHNRADDAATAQTTSLYASLYNAAVIQGVAADAIQLILRIHAPETDFRRSVRPADAVDFFFEARDEPHVEPQPGDLLYTSLTNNGETQRFWRFRTPDGVVDYYDEYGNNSRKFLMRRPVRGEQVNFASGFGMRKHPLLNTFRPHNGIDWSTSIGTPILAAGNGVVEEAKYRGEYGNHVRIRHANGYQTTYSHMKQFGPGIREGVSVRQSQVLGFVGMTGLTAGPHLHFEVLVNNRFVDPMKIQVPRERRLTGKTATDFQRERSRIEDLMRRPPILTVTK